MKKAIKSIILIIFAAVLIDQPAFAASKPGTGTLDYYNKNGIYYYNPSGDCETGTGTGRATINGSTAAEKIWSGLTSLGFTDEQAAGIMGNMQHESVGFNPAQHEGSQYKKYWPMDLSSNTDKAYGLGLIQWSFGRRTRMYNYVKEQAPDLLKFFNNPETYSMKNGNIYGMNGDAFIAVAGAEGDQLFSLELSFLYDELKGHKSYQGIFEQKTVFDSAKFFLEHVEIPRNPTIENHMNRAEDAEKFYKQFHGTTITSNPSANPATTDNSKDYAGNTILTSEESTAISKYKTLYEQIVEGTSIPWQAIAAIHYRENGLTLNSPNTNGIFRSTTKTYTTGTIDESTFVQMGKDAVNEKLFFYSRGTVFNNEKNAKNFFFLMDGASEKYKQQARDQGFSEAEANIGEGSPYVVNKADQQRDPAHNTTSWGEIKAGETTLSYPAGNKYGAFLVYKALGGLASGTGCSESTYGTGNMALNETALKFAWPVGDPHVGTMTPTEAYKAAYTKHGLSHVMPGGSSCDVFVATVARESGVDPDFACCGVQSSSIPHLEKSDKWEEITYSDPKDTSFLRPGDVLTVPGHIKMYVEKDGKGYVAQASYGNHSGQLTEKILLIDTLGRGNYRVWRYKG